MKKIKFSLSARILAVRLRLARILDLTWGFFVSRWKKLWDALLFSLSRLRTPLKKLKDRISPKQSSREENYGGDSFSSLPTKIPPTPANAGDSCKCCHHKAPWWKIILEILVGIGTFGGFGAAAYYAYIANQMWRDSHRNFVTEQRAWIQVSSLFPNMVSTEHPLESDIIFKNTGKTSAKKFSALFRVRVFKKNDSVDFDYSDKLRTEAAGFASPNWEHTFQVFDPEGSSNHPRALTLNEAQALLSGNAYLAVYGRGTYWDIFGELHWYKYCAWKDYHPGGYYNTGTCVGYTDTGDGKPPQN